MRKRQLSEAEYEQQLKDIRNELKQHELAMEQARYDDCLSDWESAKKLHDICVQEIADIMQKLHPYVPANWYNKYGEMVIPKSDHPE